MASSLAPSFIIGNPVDDTLSVKIAGIHRQEDLIRPIGLGLAFGGGISIGLGRAMAGKMDDDPLAGFASPASRSSSARMAARVGFALTGGTLPPMAGKRSGIARC